MNGLIDFFIPKEKKFFEYLDEQVSLLDRCVEKLSKSLKNTKLNKKDLEKTLIFIEKLSDEGDRIATETTNFLHQTFITPISREDIQSLTLNINRVIDTTEKIAASILYFKITKLDEYFLGQFKILKKTVAALTLIFEHPLSIKNNQSHIREIRNLENQGDILYKRGISHIFNNGANAIEVIKRKELYEITEEAIDEIDYIADIMQTVLITHS